MKTRRAYAVVFYNGHNVKTQLQDYTTDFTYTDPASNECDTIELNLTDPESRWIGAWLPLKGDQIKAQIVVENKDGNGKSTVLECGQFLLDEFSFSESTSGRSMSIRAISAPLDDAIKATERTQNWENVTIKQIGSQIAKRYNLDFLYDGQEITIKKQTQDKETDLSFLDTVCKKYGLMLKTYRNKLIIYDRAKYKQKETVATISRSQMLDFSYNTSIHGSYTGAKIDYTDNEENTTHSTLVGNGKRLLRLNEKAQSLKDAQLIAKASLENENHEITTISFSTMGRTDLSAGQTILITDFAKLSGKYYINKKTDTLSGSGYISNFECSFVNTSEQAVILEAIERLYSLKIITNKTYWINSLKKIDALGELLVNANTAVKTVADRVQTTNKDSIKILADRGVINTPAYWQKKLDYPYLKELLDNISKALM